MEYNKNQFIKSSDHKVLHKVKKNWVVLSMSLLALLGGGAVARQTVAHADPNGTQANNPTTTLKNRINASLDRAQTASSQQTAQTNVHNNQRANAQQISQQANQLHNRILNNAALISDDNGASSATDQQTSQTQSQNQKSQPQRPSMIPAQQHRTQQARALNFVQHGVNHHDYDHQTNSPVNQNSDQSTASSNSAVQSNSASTSGVKSSVNASRISAMGNEASTSVNNGKTEQANRVSINSDKQNAKEEIANQPRVGSDNSNYVDANDDQAWSKITDWSKTGNDQGLNYKYAPKEGALEFTGGTQDLSNLNNGQFWSLLPDKIISVKFDDINLANAQGSSIGFMFSSVSSSKLSNMRSLNLGNHFNTSKVTDMSYMFNSDKDLQSLDLGSSFDTSRVTNMNYMFSRDNNLQSLTIASSKTKLNKAADLPIMYKKIGGTTDIEGTPNDFSKGNIGTFTDFISTSDIFGNVDGLTAPTTLSQIKPASDWGLTYYGSGSRNPSGMYQKGCPRGWSYVDANGMPTKTPQFRNGKIMVAPVSFGLTYKYDQGQRSLEFIGGTLNWNSKYRYNSSDTYTFSDSDAFVGHGSSSSKVDASDGISNDTTMLNNITKITFDSQVDTSNLTDATGMFVNDRALTSLTLPDGFGRNVKGASQMFMSDNKLSDLTLPSDFGKQITMARNMFAKMSDLSSLGLPKGFGQKCKSFDSAFEEDKSLTNLTLPDCFGQNVGSDTGSDANSAIDPISMFAGCGINNDANGGKLTSLTLDKPSIYSKGLRSYLSQSNKGTAYGSFGDYYDIGPLYYQLQQTVPGSHGKQYYTTDAVNFINGTHGSTPFKDGKLPGGTYVVNSVKANGNICFYDNNGNLVNKSSYSGYYGNTKTVTPPPGYHFTDSNPSEQISEDGKDHSLTVLDAHTYSRPINFIYSNDNKNYNENTIDDNGHKNYELIGKVGTSQKFTAGSQNVHRLNPGWQVASDKTVTINSNSDKPQNVNVVPIHQNDSVHFVLSGSNVPAGYHGKTGLIASDSTDYSGNDYRATDAGNNSYTFNDQASNGIKGLPNGYQIAGNPTINHGKQTINYDGQTHDIQVAPVSTPVNIKYVNASDNNRFMGNAIVKFYPVVDGNTKQVTASDLEKKSGFPSGGYEVYPPSQQSFTITNDGNVIPVAKQHVVATGNWDVSDSDSARFEVVSDQKPSSPTNREFTPNNSGNTLVFISNGPLDLNSWSKAGYVDNHGKKQYVFSSDAQHSDGNSSYPNALNRNSISKVFFNPGITVKLPVGIPAGTTANKNLPNGAKSDVGLFQSMHNLKEIDFNSALDGSDAQNLSSMFANDEQLKKIDLGNLEASKVTVTSDMFAGDTALSDLTLPQNGFGKLTDIAGMFASDKSLVGNAGGTHADDNDNYNPIKKATEDIHYLSDMVVSNVTDMDSVFESDSNLQGLNLSGWQNSKNLSDMDAMFANDKQLRYLDISQLTNPNMIIGGALSDFQNDFAHPDPNNPSNSNGKYAVVLNNQMHLGSDSLLGGYWSSSDYKNDPELFSPRRIDQYGANLGPNSSATWTKVANNPSDLHDQTRQVRLYNQDNGYIGTRTVDVPKPDKNGNYLIDLSDQLRSQSMPIGYQLPPKNGYLSDIVDGNLLKRISDSSISYNDYNGHPKAYLLGYSDTQTLPVTIEYNDKPGVVEHRTIKVTGYYGDTNDAVPASDWQPGPGMNYQFDQNKSSDVYDGLLHYNMMDHGSGYQPNGNAQWNIQPKYCSRNPAQPLLYYDNRANTLLRVIYVDQSGQQVGSSDSISGPDGEVVNVTDPDDNGIKVPNGYHLIGGMTNVNKVNSDDGVYGSDQDTVYTLNGKQRTVYLHVQGDSDKYATVQVHLVMTDANGHMTTTKKSVNLNSLDGHQVHDGDEIELNPSDSQIKPQGYSADYSKDSVQFIQIGNDGKPIPNDFTFYYRSTNTTGAPIAIRYTDTDGHEVGSIKVLQGNIGDPVTVNKQAVDNKQITLPTGYSLINDKESDNRTFTDSPQIMDVKVQGNQYKGGPFVITQYDNGKQGDQYNIYVSDARVGDSFTVSPYGFSIGGVISSISGPNGSTSYNFPKSDHATPSDPDLTVRIDSDGKLSQPSINYNYQSNNVNQTKLSTIHIHYITLDKGIKMSDGNKLPDPFKSYHELDKESDSGTSNDTFDLTPYTDDIPESVSQYYDGVINQTTSSDVVDGSNNIIKLNPSGSGYQWKFGAQPTDVYIKVHKNGDGNQPIIID